MTAATPESGRVFAIPADLKLPFCTPNTYDVRKCLESFGVEFLHLIEEEGYWEVRLPTGWNIKLSEGDEEIFNLLDENGRCRSQIFAIADSEENYLMLTTFYFVQLSPSGNKIRMQIRNALGVILHEESEETSENWLAYQKVHFALFSKGEAWLDENYPNWRDPSAYWKVTQLPRMMYADQQVNARQYLEREGVVFHEECDPKSLFLDVTLPEGWRRKSGEGAWSYLIDDRMRTRAIIFCDASIFDPDVFLELTSRYTWQRDMSERESTNIVHIMDGVTRLHTIREDIPSDETKRYGALTAIGEAAKKWLDAHYPNWRDPSAYWDEPASL